MRVNTNISDLFFNYDLSDAHREDTGGDFCGYDDGVMLEKAADVIFSLEHLGVEVPTARELVDDFHARL